MGYSREIYDEAMAMVNANRTKTIEECNLRKAAFYEQYPRAAEIETELATTAIQAARAVLNGAQAKEQLTLLKQKNLSLQNERMQLLQKAGLPETYLEPSFACNACKDEGFIDGRMCSCLKKLMRIQACNQLNASTPLALCTFDNFSLSYYPNEPSTAVFPAYQQMNRFCVIVKRMQLNFLWSHPIC